MGCGRERMGRMDRYGIKKKKCAKANYYSRKNMYCTTMGCCVSRPKFW